MKKTLSVLLSVGLLMGVTTSVAIAENAGATKAKTYKNCTELNKTYKGGVAISSNIVNKGGKTKYKPHVSKSIYEANKSKDRDKDKIACER